MLVYNVSGKMNTGKIIQPGLRVNLRPNIGSLEQKLRKVCSFSGKNIYIKALIKINRLELWLIFPR